VLRPQLPELHDYRGYAGKVQSGVYRKGDKVTVLPAGITSTISAVEIGGEEVDEVFAPQSAVIHLADDIDISRGDAIVASDAQPVVNSEVDAIICWLDEKKLIKGNKYYLQHNSRNIRVIVKEIEYRIDVNTLQQEEVVNGISLNEVAKVKIRTSAPLVFDAYEDLRATGSAILIDETSNSTVAAVLIQKNAGN
jgi:sulfate adenylyltransferase subunit 1